MCWDTARPRRQTLQSIQFMNIYIKVTFTLQMDTLHITIILHSKQARKKQFLARLLLFVSSSSFFLHKKKREKNDALLWLLHTIIIMIIMIIRHL